MQLHLNYVCIWTMDAVHQTLYMLNSTRGWWFLSHSVRGTVVCHTEVFAAELWFLWINWLSGHIHTVFCRQTQVCLAHAPSPPGHRSALAQKPRNWCWAGACKPFQMTRYGSPGSGSCCSDYGVSAFRGSWAEWAYFSVCGGRGGTE